VVPASPLLATALLDGGLTPSTLYWYRVAASNSAGTSAYGAAVSAATPAPLQRPAAPGSPAAAALSSSSIQVTWAASAGATSYKVQRAPNRNGRPGTWGTATAVAASPFVSTGLSASTRYWYRVAASNAAGDSSYSSSVSATTLAPAAQPPATPANPAATAVSSTSIQVTWSASSGATGYRVQRAPDASGAPGTWGAAVSDTASPFADSGLAAGTRYWYRVAASNAAGDSAYGAAVSATTLPAPLPPATPASPAATAVSSTSIQVTWSASSGATGYKVQRAPDASGAPGTWAAAVSVAASPFLDSGLAAGTRYWYRVAASNAAGDSAYGAAVSATTQAAGGNLATFGKTTAGSDAVWFPIGPNSISLCRFALPRAGQVTKLSVRFAEQLTGHWRGVIYRAGAANAPTTLVAQSNEIAATAVGWVDLTFAAPVALAAGDYYLGVMGDDGVQVDADVAGDNVYADASYAAGAPATWSTSGQSVSSYQKPIYATYTY
jgi:phosphodiesterase/alkaline phosphatase D-like protein